MTEPQMPEPQLIFLDKGEFQRGRVVPYTESHYVGLDIRGNCVLEGERMNPLSLQLVYAAHLIPHFLSEMVSTGGPFSIIKPKESFESAQYKNKVYNIGAVVKQVVEQAQVLARNSGMPYFSVSAVTTNLDYKPRDLDGGADGEFKSQLKEPQYPGLLRKFSGETKEVRSRFFLHPTAQLYVMR